MNVSYKPLAQYLCSYKLLFNIRLFFIQHIQSHVSKECQNSGPPPQNPPFVPLLVHLCGEVRPVSCLSPLSTN
jgi:hypothetical protein